jgi:hypothetical protein
MGIPKAQIIEKDGKKKFAVLRYSDFLKLQERLEDYEDLRCLREAKVTEGRCPTIGLSDVKERLGAGTSRSSGPGKPRR